MNSTNPASTPASAAGDQPDIDNALRAALSAADRRDTVASLLSDSLRGQSRPLSILMVVVQFAMFALAIASVVWFFDAASTKWQIFYAALFLWLMNAMGMIKAWFWMQIHRNRVLREVKRLELQVARLADADA